MTYLRTVLRTSILIALLIPMIVQAQGACGKRENMVRGLIENYGEEQLGLGVSGNLLMELWSSREPPYTWTILKTYPNGVSCIAAVGTNGHWKDNEPRAFRTPLQYSPG